MALSVPLRMSQNKLDKRKNILLILTCAIFYTVFVTLMNNWKVFSFVTIICCILYTFLITSFASRGSLLLKATSTMITWFSLHAIDYLIFYCFLMIAGRSLDISKCVETVMSSGNMRAVFLAIDKLIEIVIFILCRKIYDKLRLLDQKYLGVIFAITTGSYLVMSVITAFIMSSTLWIIQLTVIFALVFIVLSFIMTVFAISLSSKYQTEKREIELMSLTNEMMKKNFEQTQNARPPSVIRCMTSKTICGRSTVCLKTVPPPKSMWKIFCPSLMSRQSCATQTTTSSIPSSTVKLKKQETKIYRLNIM